MPSGARVGCAYFGFIDTDLGARASRTRRLQVMTTTLPKFVATPAPMSDAIDAIEHGVKRRSARVWAPRYVGGVLALRGVLQPLTELQMRLSRVLPGALSLADPAQGGLSDQHAKLGVADDAVDAIGEARTPSPVEAR